MSLSPLPKGVAEGTAGPAPVKALKLAPAVLTKHLAAPLPAARPYAVREKAGNRGTQLYPFLGAPPPGKSLNLLVPQFSHL